MAAVITVAFDTSVLVAAILAEHPNHGRAFAWLETRLPIKRVASWHAMAETWATLTSLPLDPPVTAETAREIIQRLENRLNLDSPSELIYREAIRRSTSRGLRSGVLDDAIHLVSAREAAADAIVTLNPKDFERLRDTGDPDIVVPPDPPGPPASWGITPAG